MISKPWLFGIAGVLGGVLWALVPFVDEAYSAHPEILVFVPLLLLLATYGVKARFRGDVPFTAVSPLVVGLGILTLDAVWLASTTNGNLGSVFLIGIPALAGLVFVGIGSVLLARRLHDVEQFPKSMAVLFAVALPLDPVFNGIVTPLLGGGLSLYGLAWVLVGFELTQTARETRSGSTNWTP